MDDNAALGQRALRIVIPGGSGQVGRMLAGYFQQRGHHVTVLTRGPYSAPWQTIHWDAEHEGPWTEALEGADACINLAGRSVNCRYTGTNREAIYDSRIRSTRLRSVSSALCATARCCASSSRRFRRSFSTP